MYRNPKPYIPQGLSEVRDFLASMMLRSPTFIDKSGYFPKDNVDTTFCSLNEGLMGIRGALGEDIYVRLMEMSDQMRACFEGDPEDKTGDSIKGRELILDMMDLIKARAAKS